MDPTVQKKYDTLLRRLQDAGSCVVAFSGGVDSALLAHASHAALREKAIAVTAVSATSAEGEADRAGRIAAEIGVPHRLLDTPELESSEFTAGGPDRCYHCKRIRFEALLRFAREQAFAVVVEGSNADDLTDYRPGRRAVEELGIVSPLMNVGLAKDEIRMLSKQFGLSTWDHPASPCLASRIAYGETITPERLRRIDAAESFLAAQGFGRLRVRSHRGELARIELAASDFARLNDPELRARIAERLTSLGFRFVCVDLQDFRSGSMNRALEETLLGGADPETLSSEQ